MGILFPLMMNVVLSCVPREKLGLYQSLGRCLHYARAGGWTRNQRSYVHVVRLEGGVRSAAGGRYCGRCGGR